MLNLLMWMCVIWVMFKIGVAQFILATGAHLVVWFSTVLATVMMGAASI